MNTFNTASTIATMIETADTANASLAVQMETLVAEFGESPLLPMKDGGLNGNAFREGSKLETQQADADRIGLSLEKAQSLAAIRAALNTHRATLYQTYQIAYFGLETIKPTKPSAPKAVTEAELERIELIGKRELFQDSAKKARNKAKIKRAEATIALASGNKDLAGELKREAETLANDAKGNTIQVNAMSKQIADSKEGDKKSKLVEKLIAVRNEIKAAKVLDGDINAMTITEILEYLV
tara:strand:- start:1015 stop:1734 length:720 start_codon:yes stop_codon:yes gene_type:complete